MQKIQILFRKYHRHKVSLQCVVFYANFVCVDFVMTSDTEQDICYGSGFVSKTWLGNDVFGLTH